MAGGERHKTYQHCQEQWTHYQSRTDQTPPLKSKRLV